MNSSVSYLISEETQAGEARRAVASICQRLGGDETFCGRVAIVITEMARNLMLHAGGGELIIREVLNPERANLEVLAIDHGPGMKNASECLRDGYSTAGTAGTGLGSIQRLSDEFELYSQPGRGTVVWARLGTAGKPIAARFQVGGISVAMDRTDVCGDAWALAEVPGGLRILVADGLGHGRFAADAAQAAVGTLLASEPQVELRMLLMDVDRALTGTRGAAGAVVELVPAAGHVRAAGVGNIAMRLVYPDGAKSFCCENGTLGTGVRKALEFTQPWQAGALLVMHSDGLSSQWSLDDYPGLARRHPAVIAGVLYRDFRRERDDSTIVTVRHQP